MFKKLVILIFILAGGSVGYNYYPNIVVNLGEAPEIVYHPVLGMFAGALLGFLISLPLIKPIERVLERLESYINQLNPPYLIFGILGAVLGLLLALLANYSILSFDIPLMGAITPIISLVFAYSGFRFGSSRREEIRRIFQTKSSGVEEDMLLERKADDAFRKYKIVDTSAIIDGRILEVVKTGFLEGTLVISQHVLQELQFIADSSDSIKRVRGRRGLDILNALQKEENISVQMDDSELPESDEVDMKLVYLAKKMDGMIVTNDYNLNKVADFQSVQVLNVNELATALKPVVIPGENMSVLIVKKGTEREQGVAYLDDGTMVVVDGASKKINEQVEITVTSSIQTNSGRMIFAKLSTDRKAIEEQLNREEN